MLLLDDVLPLDADESDLPDLPDSDVPESDVPDSLEPLSLLPLPLPPALELSPELAVVEAFDERESLL